MAIADGQGRVRLQVLTFPDRDLPPRTLRLWQGREDQPVRHAKHGLPSPVSEQPVDLGDIVLRQPPLLAAGRVLDPHGTPVPGAHLSLEVWVDHPGFQAPDDEPAVRPASHWMDQPWVTTTADLGGSFELRGDEDSDRLRISAFRGGYFQVEPALARRGDRGVIVQLDPAGAVRGTVLLDEHIPRDELLLRLVGEGTEPGSSTGLDREASFAWHNVPPGEYRVTVHTREGDRDDDATLLDIPQVQVTGGRTTHDERLAPIDLRGALHLTQLVVRDPDGQPLANAEVWERDAGSWEARTQSNRLGELTLFGSGPLGELIVSCEGYRDLRLAAAEGRREVVLERGYSVRIAVQPVPDLPPGDEIYVYARPTDPDGLRGWRAGQQRVQFDRHGEAELVLAAPGPHALRLIQWSHGWVYRCPDEIEVLDVEEEQLFRIELTGEQLKVLEADE